MASSSQSTSTPSSIFQQVSSFPSAKLRIDQLFCEWITQEGSNSICSVLLESINSLSIDSQSGHFMGYGAAPGGVSNALNNISPRSLIMKKSPKKRTQSEMLNIENAGKFPSSSGLNIVDNTNGNNIISFETEGILSEQSKSSSNPTTITISSKDAAIINNTSSSTISSGPTTASTTSSSSAALNGVINGRIGIEEALTGHRRNASIDAIPSFYVPGKKINRFTKLTALSDSLSKKLQEIESFFRPFPHGIPVEKFVHVTKRLCGIPSFFNLPLCRRINELFGDPDSGIPAPRTIGKNSRNPSGVKIKLKTFLKFWQFEVEPFDRIERFFRVIKKHDAEYIYKDDFVPFLQELLHFHPGLDFLESHEEFQRKYALTVITRIFYKVNLSRSGKLSLREVRNSNLFAACMHVDEETDINRVIDYFSYEHFYVLYCKFYELDADKDSKLTRNDLLKYQEHSLSDAIVDRIFQVGTRVFSDGQVGGFASTGMTYPDFIFFMLSEEDKSSESALKYWFNCCDLDGDKALNPEEMKHFYRHQIHRVTSLGQESINFQDVLCQMVDMISPKDPHSITITDMLKPEKRLICGVLFDILFNLHKFMRFETRDPFQEKIRREDSFQTDWDRYAHMEYTRLSQEEEDGAAYTESSMDVDSMILSQQQQQQGGDSSNADQHNYQQALSGFEQMSSWTISDDDDDDNHFRGQQPNNNATNNNNGTTDSSTGSSSSNNNNVRRN